jgi:hypothetical protein
LLSELEISFVALSEVYSMPIKTKCNERKYTNKKIHRVKLQGSTVISNTLETIDSGKSVLFSESFIHDASTPFCKDDDKEMTEIEKSHIDGFGPLGTCGFIVLF